MHKFALVTHTTPHTRAFTHITHKCTHAHTHFISPLPSSSSPSSSHPQVVSSSLPMPGWRTAPSYSATMASVPCAATRGLRSCRSPAPATSCTALTPSGWPSPSWLKHCWARKRGKWRSTCTGRTVGPYAVCVCMFCGEVENSYKFNLLSYYGFQEPYFLYLVHIHHCIC